MTQGRRSERNDFTGRTRTRAPKRSVLIIDRVARWVITLGGIGSIAAVSLVGLFLFYVVVPLFLPPRLPRLDARPASDVVSRAVDLGVNEYRTMVWSMHRDGMIIVRRLADGTVLKRIGVPDAERLTCWSFGNGNDHCAFGYSDGSIRIGTLGFSTAYLDEDTLPAELRDLAVDQPAALREGIVERTPEHQFRFQSLALDLGDPLPLSAAPITLLDQSLGNRGVVFAALDAAGSLHVRELRERTNLLTGKKTVTSVGKEVDLRAAGLFAEDRPAPRDLLLTGLGDNALLAWSDGRLLRVDTSDPSAPAVAEDLDIVPEAGHRITALGFMLGKSSLICGDDLGKVRVWFRVKTDELERPDGTSLVMAHELDTAGSPVTALTSSQRTRMIAAGFADGTVALYQVTNDRRLARVPAADDGEPVEQVVLAPRNDLLLALAGGQTIQWAVDTKYPEINAKALFGKVWYEGYDAPAYVWQSSAATDSFEPKYSLTPLIFGTLKATLYSLLIGLPLAWFAAISTSEFVSARTKARVKPTIELMASLPSVVLGFLAALVFAPFLAQWVPAALTAVVTVPLCFLLGAYFWQLLPREKALRVGWAKLPLVALALPLGIVVAWRLGPAVESHLFAGDMLAWLDGQIGSGMGGWLFLLLPLSAVVVFFVQIQIVDTWLRAPRWRWTRARFALVDLGRFVLGVAAALGLAFGISWLLAAAGLDPRGTFVDTYVQRNALVVGVVMGFAIIPIIYTISEDALSAVPNHLRAASLGAGATQWQTAIRVVIPPATSGLFSAMMIGLGRAVGETMIVLMAAGNTPIMEWNIFNGFRTLSANIAVELPEAVQNSTHYRTLFLAALTLFVMTFILNTVAEAVRIRFRKKSLEL